jgi:hypothetical protein
MGNDSISSPGAISASALYLAGSPAAHEQRPGDALARFRNRLEIRPPPLSMILGKDRREAEKRRAQHVFLERLIIASGYNEESAQRNRVFPLAAAALALLGPRVTGKPLFVERTRSRRRDGLWRSGCFQSRSCAETNDRGSIARFAGRHRSPRATGMQRR